MWATIFLLTLSNLFMTLAWYGHLRYPRAALWLTIGISWGIALAEYCFQVPANRIGYRAGLTASQLKTLQEVITLAVFVVFAWVYLHEPPRWHTMVGFALILAGATCIFAPWSPRPAG